MSSTEKTRYIEKFKKLDVAEDKNFELIKTLIKGDEELVKAGWIEGIAKTEKLHDDFKDAALALMDAAKSKDRQAIEKKADDLETASSKFADALERFAQINETEARQVSVDTFSQIVFARTLMSIVTAVMGVAGLILAFFITRSITMPVRRIIAGLTEGAEQVASASGQVSSAASRWPRAQRAGRLHRGDLLLAGGDGLHDQAERRQRPARPTA